jgi:hypothetical protein
MWIDDVREYKIPSEFLGTKELKEQRKEICTTCDHLTSINTCDVCHCVMPAKWWLAAASCPKDKW